MLTNARRFLQPHVDKRLHEAIICLSHSIATDSEGISRFLLCAAVIVSNRATASRSSPVTKGFVGGSPETCPLTCQDIGLHRGYLPLVSSTERPPCSQSLVCPVQWQSVLILAQSCHLVQVGHPGIMQIWSSSSLVCKGLTSWHFCCSALRIRITLSSGSEQKQEVGPCEK